MSHGRPRETTGARPGRSVPVWVLRGLRGARRVLSWATSGWLTPWLLYALIVATMWLVNAHRWQGPADATWGVPR